ncbi:hypothetical protein BDR06DRAFT_977996 [Suillus hirtellus]|nr:hypothetical protein BDR06DRAFT_977996 [Suillus hirtellus]
MSLPQAVQDFFNMLSDSDIEGYNADMSISVSESKMLPGLMTSSDDFLLDPAYWCANPEQEHLIRQWFNEFVNMCLTSTALQTFDTGSMIASESELDITVTTVNLAIVIPPQTFNAGSVTKSKSDASDNPTTLTTATILSQTFQVDTGSTMESMSKMDSLLDGSFIHYRVQECNRLWNVHLYLIIISVLIVFINMTCKLSNIKTKFFDKEEMKFWVIRELIGTIVMTA